MRNLPAQTYPDRLITILREARVTPSPTQREPCKEYAAKEVETPIIPVLVVKCAAFILCLQRKQFFDCFASMHKGQNEAAKKAQVALEFTALSNAFSY